jgi:hypothetical protein
MVLGVSRFARLGLCRRVRPLGCVLWDKTVSRRLQRTRTRRRLSPCSRTTKNVTIMSKGEAFGGDVFSRVADDETFVSDSRTSLRKLSVAGCDVRQEPRIVSSSKRLWPAALGRPPACGPTFWLQISWSLRSSQGKRGRSREEEGRSIGEKDLVFTGHQCL